MKLNFECPTCEQKVDEKYVHEIQRGLNETLEQNKRSLQESKSKIKINEKTIAGLRSSLEKINDTLKSLTSHKPLLKEYVQIKENIKENKRQNKKLERKIRLENKFSLKDPIEHYLDLSHQLQKYEKSKSDLKQITDENREIRVKILTSEKTFVF
ncbi:MAG: hypothetical protein IS860_06885 [Nitrosopumilus sp.]|nr:hypothetical protein [Nitrosopumilus sp.]